MGILALIVLTAAIAAMVVVFLVKRGKEEELKTKSSVEPEKPIEKPKEPVSEPQKPKVDNDKPKEEKEPEKPKEEKEFITN